MDFLAANHVRIVGLCKSVKNAKAHCADIFAIAQLSCLFVYVKAICVDVCLQVMQLFRYVILAGMIRSILHHYSQQKLPSVL